MPRLIKLERHLSRTEMAARHNAARDLVTREHWWILYWLASGTQAARVARQTGRSAKWVGQLAARYNCGGPAAVEDQRHHNRGAAPLITAGQGRGPPTA